MIVFKEYALLFILGFILIQSCSRKENDCYSELIDQLEGATKIEYLIFLPVEGCNGCIDKTIQFIHENKHSTNLVVFLVSSQTKISRSVKSSKFADIDLVRIPERSAAIDAEIQVSGFPQLVSLTSEPCFLETLNASRIEYELNNLKLNLKKRD